MIEFERRRRIGVLLCVTLLFAGIATAQTLSPQAFGTDDYTVTTISSTSFTAVYNGQAFDTSGSIGRFGAINTLSEFYVGLDLPGGAVIDYIGLNSLTDTAGVMSVELLNRSKTGILGSIGTVSSTAHGWDTDLNPTAIGYLWNGTSGQALVLKVLSQSNPNLQFFGWVEIWWKRSVSPPPVTTTFADVPLNHPFFQFIEALAASGITGGCGGGNYCPNNPVTRGQMAVFLAKALGLHWPGV